MRHKFEETPDFTDDMPFGEALRKARRLRKMTQMDMAFMLGCDMNTISKWELGVTSPPIETAREIYKRLGIRLLIEVKNNEIYGCCRNA